MNKLFTALLPLVLGSALAQTAPTAPAAKPSPIQQHLTRMQVISTTDKATGKVTETLKDAGGAVPGQIIQLQDTVTNVGKVTLGNVAITLPLNGGIYASSQADRNDAKVVYSFDKGANYGAAPLKKTVTVEENGKKVTKTVEVKPSEYTNVRFVYGTLKAGETVKPTVRFRVP